MVNTRKCGNYGALQFEGPKQRQSFYAVIT